MLYERILAHVAATPWTIEPAKGEVIAEILNRKLRGEGAPQADLDAYLAAEMARREREKSRQRQGAVALVPLYGVMTQRADLFTEMSGMASTETVGRAIDEAAADPAIDVIVLDIDSPGGSAFGVPELGDKVAAATTQKKVIAVVNSLAASGAYWVASQSSELVVTPSGEVGSIGVYMYHVDRSEEIKSMGRVVTFVSAGERKVSLNPTQPLSALGRQQLEELVNGTYDQFVRAVAKGRNVSQAKVRDGFGRGGVVLAETAVKEGMADRIGTLDQVLARYGVSLADVAPVASAEENPDRFATEIRRRRMKLT